MTKNIITTIKAEIILNTQNSLITKEDEEKLISLFISKENKFKKAVLDYLKLIDYIGENIIVPESILDLGLKYNLFLITQNYTEKEIFLQIFGNFEND